MEYETSREQYKGFILIMKSYNYYIGGSMHRECEVWRDGNRIAISKTKKEAKDLIKHGYIKG